MLSVLFSPPEHHSELRLDDLFDLALLNNHGIIVPIDSLMHKRLGGGVGDGNGGDSGTVNDRGNENGSRANGGMWRKYSRSHWWLSMKMHAR
ncbi:hypothetical protein E3N88_32068 [Mikania micrantha]|uniref:Uncharacterized protein n=1 Tax=Mikania micrantha TaxID=192012 RepID=A0A5N6M7E8_9ASTR|nr:hypothetical protein E3N88_32068 [Mikania micrantha]